MLSKHLKLYYKRWMDKLSKAPSMLSLSNPKRLRQTLFLHARKLFMVCTDRVKVSARLRRFNKFLILILKVYKHHGAGYVIKWLKACHVCVQRKLSSKPMSSLRELERNLPLPRLINGLPSFIGTMDRKAIRSGNTSTIRLWLTILSVYRVLEAPSKPNLETITTESKADKKTINWILLTSNNILRENKMFRNIEELKATKIHRTLAAGPNYKNAYLSILTDAFAIYKDTETFKSFCNYAIQTSSDDFLLFLRKVMRFAIKSNEKFGFSIFNVSKGIHNEDQLSTGKLSFKIEAAGKVRTFAICDIWTQSLLKPLHEDLFRLLEGLPNDGTFNQEASFSRCLAKSQLYNEAFAFDLSSATDRLPLTLQEGIISMLYNNPYLGGYWGSLIANRKYIIRSKLFPEYTNTTLKYATGQPMGCLSSWAMLAVTHHLLVQVCAYRVHGSKIWFDKYEVLGDDIVIFDKKVALSYLDLMQQLDVGINLSKSLQSEQLQTFEFAKRTGLNGFDVSGLSWKQLISGNSNEGRTMFALSMLHKGYIRKPSMLVRAMLSCNFINLNSFISDSRNAHYKKLLKINILSILGSLAEQGLTSLESVVCSVIDPRKEAMFFDISEEVPVITLLRLLFGILEGKLPSDILSSYDSRMNVVINDTLINNMAYDKFIMALERWMIFIATYQDGIAEYARNLVNNRNSYLMEINDDFYNDLLWIAKSVAFTGRDMTLLSYSLDLYLDRYAKMKPFEMDAANHYEHLVDDFINSLNFDTKVRNTRTDKDLPNLLLDLDRGWHSQLEDQFR